MSGNSHKYSPVFDAAFFERHHDERSATVAETEDKSVAEVDALDVSAVLLAEFDQTVVRQRAEQAEPGPQLQPQPQLSRTDYQQMNNGQAR